jgi:hypothetical protein
MGTGIRTGLTVNLRPAHNVLGEAIPASDMGISPMTNRTFKYRRAAFPAFAALSAALLAGCYTVPPPRPVYDPPPPPMQPVVQVAAYPLRGQSAEQQDRDHYECSTWATQQTGFDPSTPGIAPHQRVQPGRRREPTPPSAP